MIDRDHPVERVVKPYLGICALPSAYILLHLQAAGQALRGTRVRAGAAAHALDSVEQQDMVPFTWDVGSRKTDAQSKADCEIECGAS